LWGNLVASSHSLVSVISDHDQEFRSLSHTCHTVISDSISHLETARFEPARRHERFGFIEQMISGETTGDNPDFI
jgi:hypothetical protein